MLNEDVSIPRCFHSCCREKNENNMAIEQKNRVILLFAADNGKRKVKRKIDGEKLLKFFCNAAVDGFPKKMFQMVKFCILLLLKSSRDIDDCFGQLTSVKGNRCAVTEMFKKLKESLGKSFPRFLKI